MLVGCLRGDGGGRRGCVLPSVSTMPVNMVGDFYENPGEKVCVVRIVVKEVL